MKVLIASDHAGFALKKNLIRFLKGEGHTIKDLGTKSEKSVDYPDFAESLGLELLSGWAKKGILICGSGVGASVAANKIRGVRAAVCHDTYSAHQGVEHDDMNVLVLGSRIVGEKLSEELVTHFLKAKFQNEERFRRRLAKIKVLEEKFSQRSSS